MRIVLLLSLLLLLVGCRKTYLDGYEIYKIPQGKHSSTKSISSIKGDVLTYEIKFDNSTIYSTVDPVNQGDINKLFGFSDCNSHHQNNSARFGWRWMNNQIEIFAYVYNDKVRKSEMIGSVRPNESHTYRLELTDDSYIFQLDGTVVEMDRTAPCQVGYYYKLYPYFGGNETAPHDITIMFKQKY